MRTGFYSWRRAAHLVAAAAPTPGTGRAHPSFLAPSPFSSFLSFPSHSHLFSLPLITTTIITTLLSTFYRSSPRTHCLRLPLFFPPSNIPFVSWFAGHYRYPSASDPFRSRFLVSQVPTLTPLENQTPTTSSLLGSVSRYLPPTRLHSFPTAIQTV